MTKPNLEDRTKTLTVSFPDEEGVRKEHRNKTYQVTYQLVRGKPKNYRIANKRLTLAELRLAEAAANPNPNKGYHPTPTGGLEYSRDNVTL